MPDITVPSALICKCSFLVTLKETHESIWDWNDGEFLEEDPAPNTTLPSPYDVNIPKNLKVESGNEHLQIKAAHEGFVI
jgi:hypothetical protein